MLASWGTVRVPKVESWMLMVMADADHKRVECWGRLLENGVKLMQQTLPSTL